MTTADAQALLARLEERLRAEPGFISHDLDRWRRLSGADSPFADLSPSAQRTLALCRTPRRTSSFASDIRDIASHVEIDAERLARFFRLVDAITVLSAASGHGAAPELLAAARDVADDEATSVDPPPRSAAVTSGALPLWLADVVDHFWAAPPQAAFPRDLDLHILLTHPVAVIEVFGLRVASVTSYLPATFESQFLGLADRPLHACLLAYGGIGLIFVDSNDSAAERRVNLAHEMAHFLVDYQSARSRLAAYDPDLLDVMDGVRTASPTEEIATLIADLPLGVQTHLLERDRTGGHVARSSLRVEDRAEQVAWELLAPRSDVLTHTTDRRREAITSLLGVRYGLPERVADSYGRFLTRLVGATGEWLDELGE